MSYRLSPAYKTALRARNEEARQTALKRAEHYKPGTLRALRDSIEEWAEGYEVGSLDRAYATGYLDALDELLARHEED